MRAAQLPHSPRPSESAVPAGAPVRDAESGRAARRRVSGEAAG
jgi:hypothetical protein